MSLAFHGISEMQKIVRHLFRLLSSLDFGQFGGDSSHLTQFAFNPHDDGSFW